MPDDLRPLPRLPLDTADYVLVNEGNLDGFIAFEPGELIWKITLIQTRTPEYYASPHDRQVYDIKLTQDYDNQADAEDTLRRTLIHFDQLAPEPPTP